MAFEDKNPTVIGSDLLIEDDDGNAVASIDQSGKGSFQNLTVVNSPEFYGKDLATEIIDPLPRGLMAYGSFNVLAFTGLTGEFGLLEVAHPDLPTRTYNLYAQWNANLKGGTGNNLGINIRYEYAAPGGTASKPTLSSTLLYQNSRELTVINVGQTITINIDFELPQGAGAYRFLATAVRLNGTGATDSGTSAVAPVYMSLKDIGPTGLNTGVINTGAGGAVAPVQSYSAAWNAQWTQPYKSNNSPGSFAVSDGLYQGYNDSSNGNRRSMAGFDWATIQSFLSGATVTGCTLRLYFQHWYNNSGGTAVIGTHNYAGGSAPGTFFGAANLVTSGGWPKPGLRTVNLGAGIGDLFRIGSAKGISLGPGSDSSHTYYGYAAGASASSDIAPRLTFYYTK